MGDPVAQREEIAFVGGVPENGRENITWPAEAGGDANDRSLSLFDARRVPRQMVVDQAGRSGPVEVDALGESVGEDHHRASPAPGPPSKDLFGLFELVVVVGGEHLVGDPALKGRGESWPVSR